jgi:hypothetical protein
MKHSTWFAAIALLPLACVQGAQSAPPSATPTPAAPVVAAPPQAAAPQETPASQPVTAAQPAPAQPVERSQPAPVAPATQATAPRPAAPQPQAEAPAAKPQATEKPQPVRVRMIVPAGTLLPIEVQTPVSTATSREGDPVIAVLTEDVPLDGFKLDKGAEVRGRVRTSVPAKRTKGQAHLVVNFDSVMEKGEKISIETESIDSLAKSTKSKDTKIIAGSAAAGLIIGAIKDGGKGAVIGTVIGGAAGTGAVLIMKGDEVELPRGAKFILAVQ